MQSLLVLQLESTGEEFSFYRNEVHIGRSPSCDLPLPDDKIFSRFHVTVFYGDGSWYAVDNGSVNGTMLNDRPLTKGENAALKEGDVLTLAKTLRFRVLKALRPEQPKIPVLPGVASYCQEPAAPKVAPPAPAAGAAKPAKKESFFRPFFGTKKPQEETPVIDDIQFRAAAPASLEPGAYFAVKIMMYREDDYSRADREQQTVSEQIKSATSSIFQAKRQETYRLSIQSPDIPIAAESAELVWNGKYAAADFDVYLPETYDQKTLRLIGRVYSGAAVLTDLKLILQVNATAQQEPTVEKCHIRSAFLSYATQDSPKVAARIQGIQLSRPDMDLFFAEESLRRGEQWQPRLFQEIENRDLFYLFWSRNAAKSEWVTRELAYAIETKGAMAVEPIPLEPPSVCPPPDSLKDRHFNDWTLRYTEEK